MIGIGSMRRAGTVGATVLALATALVGCGKIATNDSVEQQIKSQLGTDAADCPDDLEGEQGRSIVCKATRGDETFDVKVTVTSVEGDTINFNLERVAGTPGAATDTAGTDGATSDTPASDTPASDTPASDTVADVAPADPAATVDGKNVAQSVFDQLVTNGKQVNQVSCPDLQARVGASQRCSLVSGTETYGVTVTVTSVQGTDVKFDIQVDQTPQ